MDTFGEILRSSREKKGYTLEQVARDTNIARKYLNALEEENFSIFPGEPYLIGFLRNYSDYLGLDSKEIITFHKNMRLQEQPVPIEALLDTNRSRTPIILLVVSIAVVLGMGGFFLYKYITAESVSVESNTVEEVIETPDKFSYDITLTDIEDRFKEGSELQISIYNNTFDLFLKSVAANIILSIPDGETMFNLGDEKLIDLDGDRIPDIAITVNDIDINAKTTVLKIAALEQIVEDSSETGSKVPEPGVSKVVSRNQELSVILDASNPEPFILNVIFRGNTLVRYLVDRGQRIERYFDKGETLRLDINREVMLWIANAGSFKAKIAGNEINMGRAGEVSTNLIKWNKNSDSGKYELQMIPVY